MFGHSPEATTESVAEVGAFLLSDKASIITGATIAVDGGITCVDPIMKKDAKLRKALHTGRFSLVPTPG